MSLISLPADKKNMLCQVEDLVLQTHCNEPNTLQRVARKVAPTKPVSWLPERANQGVCSDLIGSIPVHFRFHADSVERVQCVVCLRFCECASACIMLVS